MTNKMSDLKTRLPSLSKYLLYCGLFLMATSFVVSAAYSKHTLGSAVMLVSLSWFFAALNDYLLGIFKIRGSMKVITGKSAKVFNVLEMIFASLFVVGGFGVVFLSLYLVLKVLFGDSYKL